MAGNIGRILILLGVILILVGLLINSPVIKKHIGNLPGDIHIRGEKFSFHFPIVTCIIISVILTILINIFLRK